MVKDFHADDRDSVNAAGYPELIITLPGKYADIAGKNAAGNHNISRLGGFNTSVEAAEKTAANRNIFRCPAAW
ncbi:MAG: hypothetical protein IPJ82_16910 [Lewinellaceae bacterium]|nr:hypothetical protein [Lewinellaceae bacterium]